jgi:hypothetical protein
MDNQEEYQEEYQEEGRSRFSLDNLAWLFFIVSAGIFLFVASGNSFAPANLLSGAASTPTVVEAARPSAPPAQSLDERRMEVSNALFSQTRHIKGDPNAPVTILEFSDFQ